MKPLTKTREAKPPAKPALRRRPSAARIPRPPGASVEIRQAAGTEPELVRQRAVLEGVCGVEFLVPEGRFAGRGVVICGGGEKYLPSVYVLVRLLRHLRCRLPIEVWHLGNTEMPEEVRGLLETVSSLGTGTAPLNQVRFTYNAYSQLSQDAQAHSGAVSSGTLKVGYSYADGSDNTVRPTGITYPDGTTTITTAYDGTDADALSRPDALKEGGTTLCSYRYLGSGMIIGVKYDAASNVKQTFRDGGTGDAGDPYTGLDRFGRLIETLWKKGAADRVRSQYGRNRFGGITWRRDDRAHAQGVDTEDNDYSYDGLYQVKERQRGNLTGSSPDYTGITNLQQQEGWTYDATGNWAAYSDTSPTNAQTRTHNAANEITQIAASPGNINPAYDPAGNMTTLPRQPGLSTGQFTLKWDAWNRLTQVKDGGTVLASYTYDGLTRRLTKTNATETRHYYYNAQWRAVEERVEGAATPVDRQYTWGLRDRWDLLRRKRSVATSLDETLYVLRDYLDPVALVDGSGNVLERYAYDAFGNVRFLAPDYTSRTESDFDWTFLFHGEFLDQNTNLYNYGYRYYSANLGRWLSRDPIGEDGGLNLYTMLGNYGIGTVDFLGLEMTASGAVMAFATADAALPDPTDVAALPKAIGYAIAAGLAYLAWDSWHRKPVAITPKSGPDPASPKPKPTPAPTPIPNPAPNPTTTKADCDMLHDKYKAAQDSFNRNPCSKAKTCDEIKDAIKRLQNEIDGRQAYLDAGCDIVSPTERDHPGHIQRLKNESMATCLKIEKKLCC